MVLSDNLLDAQGKTLLPQGATLSEQTIKSLHKHDVASLRIVMGELTDEEELAQRAHFEARLGRLFRNVGEDETTNLLYRYIKNYRLGAQP